MAVSKPEAARSPQTRVAIAREGMEIENEDDPEAPCGGGVSDD